MADCVEKNKEIINPSGDRDHSKDDATNDWPQEEWYNW